MGSSKEIMEEQTSAMTPPLQSQTHTVRGVFMDFKGRRAGVLKALTCDAHEVFLQCDPGKDNLCLYGFQDGSWEVSTPQQDLPGVLPEPVPGINFCRDGMVYEKWLSFLAIHCDSWLISVAYFLCAPFDQIEKKKVFDMINDLPTVLEIVEGKEVLPEVTAKNPVKTSTVGNIGKEGKSAGSNKKPAVKDQTTSSQILLQSLKKKEEIPEDDHSTGYFCGACGVSYIAGEFWIACDYCEFWFHGKCAEITPARAESIKRFKCPRCRRKKARM